MRVSKMTIAIWILVLASVTAQAEPFELPGDVPTSEVLPADSPKARPCRKCIDFDLLPDSTIAPVKPKGPGRDRP